MLNPFKYINQNLVSSPEAQKANLGSKLQKFYEKTLSYPAFLEATMKPEFWEPVKNEAKEILAKKNECQILEFGAGKTGFAKYLGDMRKKVSLSVQDVTSINTSYLKSHADNVIIGPIKSITGKYDIIFSTFVWEHVCDPAATIEHLFAILKPGGSLFLVAPRYDFPFYISNSAKHLSYLQKLTICLWLPLRRILAKIRRKADFLIHLDPAVFHLPFSRDIDAIHWVSLVDLELSIPKGFSIRKLRLPHACSLKEALWARFLLLNIQISKIEAND